jgi:hypothetical protein
MNLRKEFDDIHVYFERVSIGMKCCVKCSTGDITCGHYVPIPLTVNLTIFTDKYIPTILPQNVEHIDGDYCERFMLKCGQYYNKGATCLHCTEMREDYCNFKNNLMASFLYSMQVHIGQLERQIQDNIQHRSRSIIKNYARPFDKLLIDTLTMFNKIMFNITGSHTKPACRDKEY